MDPEHCVSAGQRWYAPLILRCHEISLHQVENCNAILPRKQIFNAVNNVLIPPFCKIRSTVIPKPLSTWESLPTKFLTRAPGEATRYAWNIWMKLTFVFLWMHVFCRTSLECFKASTLCLEFYTVAYSRNTHAPQRGLSELKSVVSQKLGFWGVTAYVQGQSSEQILTWLTSLIGHQQWIICLPQVQLAQAILKPTKVSSR